MCNCIKEMNAKLEERKLNTVIDVPFEIKSDMSIGCERVKIVTAKKDSAVRKRPVNVFSSYCPFCGEKCS